MFKTKKELEAIRRKLYDFERNTDILEKSIKADEEFNSEQAHKIIGIEKRLELVNDKYNNLNELSDDSKKAINGFSVRLARIERKLEIYDEKINHLEKSLFTILETLSNLATKGDNNGQE